MPPAGSSERMDFLRARIAALEESSGLRLCRTWRAESADDPRLSLGDAKNPCSLDRALQGGLAFGALHEIVAARPGDRAASSGFAWALAARFNRQRPQPGGKIIWIIETKSAWETGIPYGPGLGFCGLDPEELILVETRDAREGLWAMEEALKCRSPAAVIGEICGLAKIYDLAASRRLVLAARKSGTPGLLIAAGFAGAADRLSSGAETRFEIATSTSSQLPSAGSRLPLPGKTVWAVRLVKARAGPHGFGFDRDKIHPLFWDSEKACFCDALPFALSALSGHGPVRPAWRLPIFAAGPHEGPGAARNLHQNQIGLAAGRARSMRAGARA